MDVPISNKLIKLAVRIGEQLEQLHYSLTAAESCTGGWISQILTAVPTSSTWFDRGFVTYSEQSKTDMLHVSPDNVKKYGAVSEEVAIAMAKGAIENSNAQVSVAVTGLAGPDKDQTSCTPVGTCWFAWSVDNKTIKTARELFDGDRNSVNYQAVERALAGLLEMLHAK